jgi:hypothetical protein
MTHEVYQVNHSIPIFFMLFFIFCLLAVDAPKSLRMTETITRMPTSQNTPHLSTCCCGFGYGNHCCIRIRILCKTLLIPRCLAKRHNKKIH